MTASERVLCDGEEPDDVACENECLGDTTSTVGRSKYRSMDFSGSVFLISSNGKILKLPIPSESPDDPLSWSKKRRFLIFTVLTAYAILPLALIQAPGNLMKAFLKEFAQAVCSLSCPVVAVAR